MLTLHQIKNPDKKDHKRVGRGISAGGGKTCGRGTKGQKARSKIRPGFEGGQMPFIQKIPKQKGFTNIFAKEVSVINLDDLEKNFPDGAKINPDLLTEKKLVHKGHFIKVLGDGELKKKLTIEVHGFSKQAEAKIKQAGGQAVIAKYEVKKELPKPENQKIVKEIKPKIVKKVVKKVIKKVTKPQAK